jgi:hypothetical protein
MDTEKCFAELAEKICARRFGGCLPDDAENIASDFLTSALPHVREFFSVDEEIARAAFERIADSLVSALQAHYAMHQPGWDN